MKFLEIVEENQALQGKLGPFKFDKTINPDLDVSWQEQWKEHDSSYLSAYEWKTYWRAGASCSATVVIWSTDSLLPACLAEAKAFIELSGGAGVNGGYTGMILSDNTTLPSAAYGGPYGYLNLFLGAKVDVASGLFSASIKGGVGCSYKGRFEGQVMPPELKVVNQELTIGELKVRYDASVVWGIYQYREEYKLWDGVNYNLGELQIVPFSGE